MNSDTPRTDALDKDLTSDALTIHNQGGKLSDIIDHIVGNLCKHSRTLERENQQLRADLKQCAEAMGDFIGNEHKRGTSDYANAITKLINSLALPSVQADLKEHNEH